jgi:hypothetical protein
MGTNTTVHGSYFRTYKTEAVEFVVSQYNASPAEAQSTTGGTNPSSGSNPPSGAGVSSYQPNGLVRVIAILAITMLVIQFII